MTDRRLELLNALRARLDQARLVRRRLAAQSKQTEAEILTDMDIADIDYEAAMGLIDEIEALLP